MKWSNDKFIALGRGSGSDTWLNIILPLTKGAEAKLYDNPLAVDKDNGIIVCEYYSDTDTVLLAENIITGKNKQSVKIGKSVQVLLIIIVLTALVFQKNNFTSNGLFQIKLTSLTRQKLNVLSLTYKQHLAGERQDILPPQSLPKGTLRIEDRQE